MQEQDEVDFYKNTQKIEAAFIGAILLENTLMEYALEHLDSHSFVMYKHGPIFAAMIELFKKHADISPENMIKELREHGDIAKVGGESYIHSLNENVPHTLTIENEDYVERFAFIAVSMAMTAAAFSEMEILDIANLVSEKLGRVKELRTEMAKKKLRGASDEGLIC